MPSLLPELKRTTRFSFVHRRKRSSRLAKKYLILAIKLLILIALLVYVARNFPEAQWKALREQPKNWGWLSVALAIVLSTNLLSFIRWRLLVQALEVPMSLLEAIRLGSWVVCSISFRLEVWVAICLKRSLLFGIAS